MIFGECEIPVIDVYKAFKALKHPGTDISTYMSQRNHPNELGHEFVVAKILKTLFKDWVE